MMKKGKYAKKKNTGVRWSLIVLLLIAVGLSGLWIVAQNQELASVIPTETSHIPETEQRVEGSAEAEPAQTTEVAQSTEPEEIFQSINLGYGVSLEEVRSYTGTYMEDGSDQLVSDVMMIRVHNSSEDDIQLMNIDVGYIDETYHFVVTNLPAGETAVLLEQERAPMPVGNPVSAVASNVVLFADNMHVDLSIYEVSGADGVLNVKNVSGADISGDIYVYYKYKIQDVYYGGITFRVRIEGGLAIGEIRQVVTSHYNPDNCEVIMIETILTNGN